MATWKKILTEKKVKDRTLNVMLGQTSTTGIKAGHVNFIRPIEAARSASSAHFPHLEFSDNQTFDNKAIKKWSYGTDETGSDSTTAYFNLVGDMSMDSPGDSSLYNSLMGCAIPVPMGRSDVGFHDIEFNFITSHEGGHPGTQIPGISPYPFSIWKPTIWRAYANDELTVTGNPSLSTTLQFRLVMFDDNATYSIPGGGFAWDYSSDNKPGTVSGAWCVGFRVPVHSDDDSWVGKTCYYMVGLHVGKFGDGSNPQNNSLQWPSTAHPVTGLKQCSAIANFRVTYRAN